jgi:ubiquinone/menaquinone biosynthesis C-methylase UbiE/nucleoside 2-deoxyribosyltransferase
VVVCGSYRKDTEGLRKDYKQLKNQGVLVLSPLDIKFVEEVNGFVLSEAERSRAPEDIEKEHLLKISQADFIWLHTPEGYIGASGAMELGYAYAKSIPVYSKELPKESVFQPFVTRVKDVREAVELEVAKKVTREILLNHVVVYDNLADEYSGRVNKLTFLLERVAVDVVKLVPPGATVLDVGCGAGGLLKELSNRGCRVVGIDISENMLRKARETCPDAVLLKSDLLTLPRNETYDALTALAFIHLFPREAVRGVLLQMRALLKEQGVLYIGTTDSREYSEGFETKSDYASPLPRFRAHWPVAELKQVLEEEGFSIEETILHEDPWGKTWVDLIALKKVTLERCT